MADLRPLLTLVKLCHIARSLLLKNDSQVWHIFIIFLTNKGGGVLSVEEAGGSTPSGGNPAEGYI